MTFGSLALAAARSITTLYKRRVYKSVLKALIPFCTKGHKAANPITSVTSSKLFHFLVLLRPTDHYWAVTKGEDFIMGKVSIPNMPISVIMLLRGTTMNEFLSIEI